jgi:hypothetical protein
MVSDNLGDNPREAVDHMSVDFGTMESTKGNRPSFKGLQWYREDYFSLFVPTDWLPRAWTDGRQGVLFVPDAKDAETLLGIEVKDLGFETLPDDKDDLLTGFLEGIHSLPQSVLEEQKDWVVDKRICLEARYHYADNGQMRKRWTRVFYEKTRQISFMAQGSSPETFAYWLPMFYEAMMTARLHQQKPEIPS